MKEVYVVVNADRDCIVFESKELADQFQRQDFAVSESMLVQTCLVENICDLNTIRTG